jgi:hypothetical protein
MCTGDWMYFEIEHLGLRVTLRWLTAGRQCINTFFASYSLVLLEGTVFGQVRDQTSMLDLRVVPIPLDTLYQRLAHIPLISYYPLVETKWACISVVLCLYSECCPHVLKMVVVWFLGLVKWYISRASLNSIIWKLTLYFHILFWWYKL